MEQCKKCGYIYSDAIIKTASDYARYYPNQGKFVYNYCNNCNFITIYKANFFGKLKPKKIITLGELLFTDEFQKRDPKGGFYSQHMLRLIWDCLVIQQGTNGTGMDITFNAFKLALKKFPAREVGFFLMMLQHYFQLGGIRYYGIYMDNSNIENWLNECSSDEKIPLVREIYRNHLKSMGK
ncbi:MAG: hypothetical protein Wins2KO_11720 [Winogradskyella sp.]